jgi:hypothetical protein
MEKITENGRWGHKEKGSGQLEITGTEDTSPIHNLSQGIALEEKKVSAIQPLRLSVFSDGSPTPEP